MEKFFYDMATWYWWLSVVIVGLAVNLLSAYAKPWIDRWWGTRSERARSQRSAEAEAFEKEVNRLASNSTLLIVAGQRLHSAEAATLVASVFFIFLLVFSSFVSSSASISATIKSSSQVLITISLCVNVVLLLVFMRREAAMDAIVRRARKLFESAGG